MNDAELDPLSPAVGALAAAERRRAGVVGAEERIFERLATSVAIGAPGASVANADGMKAASALTAKTATVVAAAFIAGAGAGAALHARFAPPPASGPVVNAAIAPVAVVAPASAVPPGSSTSEPASNAVEASDVAPSPPRVSASTPKEPLGERDADLSRERSMIERARMASARLDPAGALAALEEHARSFPRGRLAEEREVLAVGALADLGRPAEAEVRAARFRRRHPSSVSLPAVEAAVERAKKSAAP